MFAAWFRRFLLSARAVALSILGDFMPADISSDKKSVLICADGSTIEAPVFKQKTEKELIDLHDKALAAYELDLKLNGSPPPVFTKSKAEGCIKPRYLGSEIPAPTKAQLMSGGNRSVIRFS